MMIDCGRCEMRGTGCPDCVVTFLEPRTANGFCPDNPAYLGEPEVKALRVLADAGLVPPLRLTPADSRLLPGARAWIQRAFPEARAS